jgi:hypothetical protein
MFGFLNIGDKVATTEGTITISGAPMTGGEGAGYKGETERQDRFLQAVHRPVDLAPWVCRRQGCGQAQAPPNRMASTTTIAPPQPGPQCPDRKQRGCKEARLCVCMDRQPRPVGRIGGTSHTHLVSELPL